MVFADASNIGWQVTGRFPNRREGEGLLPSPGWEGRYDWDGYADPMLHPYDQDPTQGWLGTANQRVIPHGYGMQLSNSWAAPERGERLAELANSGKQDGRSVIAMQYDQTTTFAAKLKKMFEAPGMKQPLKQAIDALPEADRSKAREAFSRLMAFDGKLSPTSADAAIYELFLQASMKQIFLDELGPESSPAWKAFVANGDLSYAAQADHLLGREDSPFWDDIHTPQKKTRRRFWRAVWQPRSTPATVSWVAITRPGSGANCTATHGKTPTARPFAAHWQPVAITPRSIPRHLPGSGLRHHAGAVDAFHCRLQPDRTLDGQNATGQSGNPASPNYLNGIDAWLKGQYIGLPMQPQNFDRVYGKTRLTLTPANKR